MFQLSFSFSRRCLTHQYYSCFHEQKNGQRFLNRLREAEPKAQIRRHILGITSYLWDMTLILILLSTWILPPRHCQRQRRVHFLTGRGGTQVQTRTSSCAGKRAERSLHEIRDTLIELYGLLCHHDDRKT